MRSRLLLAGMTVVLAGCASGAPGSPTPAPSTGNPPTASPTSAVCLPAPTAFVPPSNRLVGIVLNHDAGLDQVVLQFGLPAPNGSLTAPGAIIGTADPPFTEGASGRALPVEGDVFVTVLLRDMVVADDAGNATYVGSTDIRPADGVVREVVQAEAFEGVIHWLIGVTEPGCYAVRTHASAMQVVIAFSRG